MVVCGQERGPLWPLGHHKGDDWHHVAYDPEHRLTVSVVPGARTIENTELIESRAIDTAFLEREEGTNRDRNSHEAYQSSKEWRSHEAATYLSLFSYNFCWEVRTLAMIDEQESWSRRTPAMTVELTDHVRSMAE